MIGLFRVTSFSRIPPRRALVARTPKQGAVRGNADVSAETVVSKITACIGQLQAAGYLQTAEILAIARLDLLVRLHGVSDEELEFLICAPQTGPQDATDGRSVRAKSGRKKPCGKNGSQNKSG
jgi:hypothetical protein